MTDREWDRDPRDRRHRDSRDRGAVTDAEAGTNSGMRFSARRGSGGRDWAVEVDGPKHFLASGAPTGGTLLKRRTLQLLGHALVSVPYWEWAACRGAGEREQYLRSKLGACAPSAAHGDA